jgi:hypothetical protein
VRRHLRPCRGPWHVDETFVRVGVVGPHWVVRGEC